MQQQSMLHTYLVASQDCLLDGNPTLALAMAQRALGEANKFQDHKRKGPILKVINYLRLVVRRGEQ